MGSDKEVETEPFDGSNKHDQATQKLCPKRAKENEGQPLSNSAEFQKPAFQWYVLVVQCVHDQTSNSSFKLFYMIRIDF